MINNILVSIIIPCYNKDKYIERCLCSVEMQNYNNIECIIIDDCSNDNSLQIIESYISNYKGNITFYLIRHKENTGPGPSIAKNNAINISTGKYLFFLDADDEITDNCIFSLVELAEKYPGVDMIQGGILQKKDKYEVFFQKDKKPEILYGNDEIRKLYNIHGSIPVTTWNKLVRKDFIINNNLYFKKGLVHEDIHWNFFWLKKIESLAVCEKITYIYNIVSDSITTNSNLFHSISTYLIIVEDILSNIDINYFEQELEKAILFLNMQNDIILSDEKYSSLIPKYKYLLNRIPGIKYYLFFIIKLLNCKIKKYINKIRN